MSAIRFMGVLEPTSITKKISEKIDLIVPDRLTALEVATQWVKQNIEFAEDIETYNIPEYFAPPDQTLSIGKGDCEDMSMLIASILNGMDKNKPDDVCMTIGQYASIPLLNLLRPDMYHAWLEADIDGSRYIADGVTGRVHKSPRSSYIPLIALYNNRLEFI